MIFILSYAVLILFAGHVGEILWADVRRNPKDTLFDSKTVAFKCWYAGIALCLILPNVSGSGPAILGGIPICLTHLALIKKNPSTKLTAFMIAGHMWDAIRLVLQEFTNSVRSNLRQ